MLQYQCSADVPVRSVDLAWNDNCDGTGMAVTVTDVSDGASCPEVITRTWTYTDACGNNATVSQLITVDDTQVPVFVAQPIECCSSSVQEMFQ